MSAIDFPNSPTVDDQYTVDGSTWIWTGVAWDILPGLAASTVSSLLDVELTDLADNQVLIYHSSTSKWENVDTNVLTGTNYDVLDGGNANSTYLVTVNGGGANG